MRVECVAKRAGRCCKCTMPTHHRFLGGSLQHQRSSGTGTSNLRFTPEEEKTIKAQVLSFPSPNLQGIGPTVMSWAARLATQHPDRRAKIQTFKASRHWVCEFMARNRIGERAGHPVNMQKWKRFVVAHGAEQDGEAKLAELVRPHTRKLTTSSASPRRRSWTCCIKLLISARE